MIKKLIDKLNLVWVSVFVFALFPLYVFAQNTSLGAQGTFGGFLSKFKDWVDALIPITMSLAVAAFFFGLVKYLWGSPEDQSKGMKIMMMGVLAVFVMASLGGLVAFIGKTVGLQERNSTLRSPCIGGCPGNQDNNWGSNQNQI